MSAVIIKETVGNQFLGGTTGFYRWVTEYPDAYQFPDLESAVRVAQRLVLQNVQVIQAYGTDQENVALEMS